MAAFFSGSSSQAAWWLESWGIMAKAASFSVSAFPFQEMPADWPAIRTWHELEARGYQLTVSSINRRGHQLQKNGHATYQPETIIPAYHPVRGFSISVCMQRRLETIDCILVDLHVSANSCKEHRNTRCCVTCIDSCKET